MPNVRVSGPVHAELVKLADGRPLGLAIERLVRMASPAETKPPREHRDEPKGRI